MTIYKVVYEDFGAGKIGYSGSTEVYLYEAARPTNTNVIYWLLVNDSVDSGNTASIAYYSNGSGGPWILPDKLFLDTNPSVYYKQILSSGSPAVPSVNDKVTLQVSSGKQIVPSSGHTYRYLISETEYLSAQYTTVLSLSNEATTYYDVDRYKGDFYFNINQAVTNYIYIIFDYRN